jgi:hypothetical protein
MRKDIEFPATDGTILRGWHYLPDGRPGKHPTIVMAHGFSAVKGMYLDKYAESFAWIGILKHILHGVYPSPAPGTHPRETSRGGKHHPSDSKNHPPLLRRTSLAGSGSPHEASVTPSGHPAATTGPQDAGRGAIW